MSGENIYQDMLAALRGKREREAMEQRANAELDAEERATRRRATNDQLLAMVTGGTFAYSPLSGREGAGAALRAAGFGDLLSPAPAKVEKPAIDPDGDPLELLSKEERELLERRPYLKKLLLEDIDKAEATVRAERERQVNAKERDQAHAENDRTHEIAARIIKQRAEARGRG